MAIHRARLWLLLPFLGGLVSQLVVVFWVFARGMLWDDAFQALVLTLLAVYSVPLGTVLAGLFAMGRSSRRTMPTPLVATAAGLAVLWNVLLVPRTLYFAWGTADSFVALKDYWSSVGSVSLFLISGMLTYTFVREGA